MRIYFKNNNILDLFITIVYEKYILKKEQKQVLDNNFIITV